MSKLPVLMLGTGQHFDYICLAIRGNIGLGVKVMGTYVDHHASEIRVGFRVRSAIHTPHFIERITGDAPTETFKPEDAFPGQYSKIDVERASFTYDAKKSVSFEVLDDGSFPSWSDLGENLNRMIGSIFEFVTIPEGSKIITPSADLAEHLAKLMYPAFMEVYGVACQQKYGDTPPSSQIAKGLEPELTSATPIAFDASLEGAAAELLDPAGGDDNIGDDGEGGDDAPTEEQASGWGSGSSDDYDDKVTPFPGKTED
ncbi:hypothetical protein EVC30_019 [Rhizobium phage RHph_Y1_11]|nr:hypothetical protein EVC30_019 [Rhizobium phage RHph_Y1_11]